MTLAVAHRDSVTKRVVLDAIRERRPPFSPDQVAKDFADLLAHLSRHPRDRRQVCRRMAA